MAKHLVHRKKTITYVGDGKEEKKDNKKDKTKVVPIDTSEMPPIDKNNGFIMTNIEPRVQLELCFLASPITVCQPFVFTCLQDQPLDSSNF